MGKLLYMIFGVEVEVRFHCLLIAQMMRITSPIWNKGRGSRFLKGNLPFYLISCRMTNTLGKSNFLSSNIKDDPRLHLKPMGFLQRPCQRITHIVFYILITNSFSFPILNVQFASIHVSLIRSSTTNFHTFPCFFVNPSILV